MPRGRFVSKKIALDPKLNQLDDTTFLFFLMLIPHLDAEGRMWGDAVIVKGMCCPYRDWSIVQVENMLSSLEAIKREDGLGVIVRYERYGHKCLWMAGFEGEQKGLQKDHETKGKYGYSDVPPPPQTLVNTRDKASTPVEKKSERSTKAKQPIETAAIVDPKLASMVKYYEDSIGMVTPNIFENLKLLCDEHDETEFQRAVDQAKGRKVRSPIRYIEKCLENWKKENTPEESPEAEKDWEGIS